MTVRMYLVTLAIAATVATAGTARAQCTGDCDGDSQVAVNELIIGVGIALGQQAASACPAYALPVTIDQLVRAVDHSLSGCPATPTPTITPPPDDTATPTASATPVATETETAAATETETPVATETAVATETETPVATDTPEPPATVTATPDATSTPEAVCGNGIAEVQFGETCDDGNTEDSDGCPANCRVALCTVSDQRLTMQVDFASLAEPAVPLQGLTTFLRYPDGVVGIPSAGSLPPVLDRVTSDIFSLVPYDTDFSLTVVALDPLMTGYEQGTAFTVVFDVCAGASPPDPGAFTCFVKDAVGLDFSSIPGEQVACRLTVIGAPTPTPTATHTEAPTATSTTVPTATVEATNTVAPTFTATAAATPSATRTATAAATATPSTTRTATATPTVSGATCGNNILEPGETCGTCPGDCAVLACAATAPTIDFVVDLEPPLGQDPTAATVLIGYNSSRLSIPGSVSVTSVRQRFILPPPLPQSFVPNDLDYAARVVITRTTPLGRLFTVRFDRCTGAPAPTLADLACTVEGCAASGGPISDCACTVSLP